MFGSSRRDVCPQGCKRQARAIDDGVKARRARSMRSSRSLDVAPSSRSRTLSAETTSRKAFRSQTPAQGLVKALPTAPARSRTTSARSMASSMTKLASRCRPSSAGSAASTATGKASSRSLSTTSTAARSMQASGGGSAFTSRGASVQVSRAVSAEASRAPSMSVSRAASAVVTPAISAVTSPRRHWTIASRSELEPSKLHVVLDSLIPVDGISWSAPSQPVVPPSGPPTGSASNGMASIPPLPVADLLPSPCGVFKSFELVIPSVEPIEDVPNTCETAGNATFLTSVGEASGGETLVEYDPVDSQGQAVILAGQPTPVSMLPPYQAPQDFMVVVPAPHAATVPSKSERAKMEAASPDKTGCRRSSRRGFAQRVLGVGHSPLVRRTLSRLAAAGHTEAQENKNKDAMDPEGKNEFFELHGQPEELRASPGEVRQGLSGDAPEALLWELRCRLTSAGVRPPTSGAFRRAAELARRRPETAVERAIQALERVRLRLRRRQRSRSPWPASTGFFKRPSGQHQCSPTSTETVSKTDAADLVEICNIVRAAQSAQYVLAQWPKAAEAQRAMRLSSVEWTRLCASLNFNPEETQRLCGLLGAGHTAGVDLCRMFDVLSSIVAPNISLEPFASRTVARFGSLQAAFGAFCDQRSGVMGWPEFNALTTSLDVNSANAEKLWCVLLDSGQPQLDLASDSFIAEIDCGGRIHRNITRDDFIVQVGSWMPSTALDSLADQLIERFGSLEQSIHVLEQKGLDRAAPLTAANFDAVLRTVGIRNCDTERVLHSVASLHPSSTRQDSGVSSISTPAFWTLITLTTLMQVLSTLQRAARRGSEQAAVVVCDQTLPIWKQLHALQAELSSGLELARADRVCHGNPPQAKLEAPCVEPEMSLTHDEPQGDSEIDCKILSPVSRPPKPPPPPPVPPKRSSEHNARSSLSGALDYLYSAAAAVATRGRSSWREGRTH